MSPHATLLKETLLEGLLGVLLKSNVVHCSGVSFNLPHVGRKKKSLHRNGLKQKEHTVEQTQPLPLEVGKLRLLVISVHGCTEKCH